MFRLKAFAALVVAGLVVPAICAQTPVQYQLKLIDYRGLFCDRVYPRDDGALLALLQQVAAQQNALLRDGGRMGERDPSLLALLLLLSRQQDGVISEFRAPGCSTARLEGQLQALIDGQNQLRLMLQLAIQRGCSGTGTPVIVGPTAGPGNGCLCGPDCPCYPGRGPSPVPSPVNPRPVSPTTPGSASGGGGIPVSQPGMFRYSVYPTK